jgi:signal transduction histidine kinase
MPIRTFAIDSLRRKIVFGYGAVAALVVGLSVFSLVDMRLLEAQISAGERIGQFFGIALEIRRFEKNYFLYRESADFEENRAYVAQGRRLLVEHGKLFASFEQPERLRALLDTLDDYAALMAAQAGEGGDPRREAAIRQAGKEIVTVAEGWARTERTLLQDQLARHRLWLIVSIGVVAVLVIFLGQLLARRVARPLKQMEQNMAAVAEGRLAQLEMTADDREIASLTRAFNRVLHELELRQGQLVRSEKLAALGTLLSGVAHELNNPLSNISTSCEILAEELADQKVGAGGTVTTADQDFVKELLVQIDAETWRARRIVRSLLDYARDREFRREPLALAPLVEESLRLIKGQIPARVSIDIAIPAELTLAGDKQRLQQVLFNLVGNAVAALEGAGEIAVAARATRAPVPANALAFGQCPGGAAVEIEVRDNGHGIPAEVLPRIFDPFFTTKEVGQGLGLGLFVVFEIVEEHGGCIAVKSTPGQGSSFIIRLPAEENTP